MALLLLPLLSGGAVAAIVGDLYGATVRVADRSQPARDQAVVTALGVVLTKLSGQREAALRLAASQVNAVRWVQRVGYVSGGQLEVGFDTAAIQSLLDQSGLPVWDRVRPVLLVVYPLALMGVPEVRAATESIAKERGLPVVWTALETSDQYSVTNGVQIQALATQYHADSVLLARSSTSISASTSADAAAVATEEWRWQLVFRGTSQEWKGTLDQGVHTAADQIGRYYAVSPKQNSRQLIEISGINSVESYARVIQFFNDLLTVREVSIQALQADVLRVQLDLRGTQLSLRRLLSVASMLTEQNTSNADTAGVMSYRYTP